ncbi:thiamine pyrophosphate-binding protein [Bradyrhizobium sp. NAS80.1]|uniref:thiamine pyrophosphate-binding protein n=1 Tax=Bradyrhizobium sp. NAS80.1 TaxID=1680159 RepID=UPI000A98EC35|nr:thiamine pyrophosphate-binding protein [Bradyrhizobium sp. NAS80.1]
MSYKLRGADIVARSLERLGCGRIFTLSGNHIMSIFDAVIDTKIQLTHVRHEAAAVHMADGWGRITGEPGVAMVTGGPGHVNALGALFAAQAAESPMVLLSGHAATWELGRGGFQEIRQADMAKPVTKASWTAKATASLGKDIGEAFRLAREGRPGPVHVSLPSDLLDETVVADDVVWPDERGPSEGPGIAAEVADSILAAIASAERPIIFAPPSLSNVEGRELLKDIELATNTPTVVLESPRGTADSGLGGLFGSPPDCRPRRASGKGVRFHDEMGC